MIDRGHILPLTRQAKLLRLSRSSVYYRPWPVWPARLAVMHRIDVLHLEHLFAGRRILRDMLRAECVVISRLAVATLMRRMRIEALHRRPSTSKPAAGHKTYPYLLRGLATDRPEPGLGDGHHAHSDSARLRLPGGGGGSVQPTSAGQAESALQQAKLRIERGCYFYGALFPLVAAVRFAKRILGDKGDQPRSDMQNYSPVINQALWTACRAELPLFRWNRLGGLTVFVRAVKP